MSNNASTDSPQAGAARPRRALIIADSDEAANLSQTLADAGYEILLTTSHAALRSISLFNPEVCLMILARGANAAVEHEGMALARRLRAEPATYALPLVLLWKEDEQPVRNLALSLGADDYFELQTVPAEMLARLDSLFWRVEAGRRAAAAVGDQRLEIDNFMLMLDSVRQEMRAGSKGTLALVYAVAREGDDSFDRETRDRILAEAHGFLKLQLRRIDAVAFYGPTTLLVYLPRTQAQAATEALSKQRGEFMLERTDGEIVVGLASFPADGADVESLIEKAEQAVSLARLNGSPAGRVVAYSAQKVTDTLSSVATSIVAPQHKTEAAAIKETRATEAKLIGAPPLAGNTNAQASRADASAVVPRTASAAVKGNGGALSVGEASARGAAEAAARERERRAQGAVMPRRLLLTVSDAARMAQLNSLIRSAGYEARAAFDGQQALDLLRIERPDLLLLDYDLTGINGVEMLRRLRKQSGGRLTLPVVLLLSPGHEQARREALELGARSVVQTPYDPADLLASVRLAGSSE